MKVRVTLYFLATIAFALTVESKSSLFVRHARHLPELQATAVETNDPPKREEAGSQDQPEPASQSQGPELQDILIESPQLRLSQDADQETQPQESKPQESEAEPQDVLEAPVEDAPANEGQWKEAEAAEKKAAEEVTKNEQSEVKEAASDLPSGALFITLADK